MSKHTEKGWCLVNATGRGRPIVIPMSFGRTKRLVEDFREEFNFRHDFTIVRATIIVEAP